jgi:hypothetical protein
MAFPSIRSFNTTNGTTATGTPVINLPATIRAGDIIWVFFRVAVAGAIGWPDATWNEMFDSSPDGADDQNAAAWRKADGTEGATITLTCTSGKFAAVSYAIQDSADPTIRPPELSTVAIGTTAQPNATTCTPTGGAKDYLWLTFVGQEGEQTGITSYPTNYTLGQSGLVNSGTAAAVTTNVTIQAAARQANAASEDAGAWTIAGTLSNWSAWTIAFHPAAALPQELDHNAAAYFAEPVRFSKPSNSLASLTLAVNLLQSTLVPVPDTNYQSQEVLISSKLSARLSELIVVNNLLETTLKPIEDAPFVPIDFRNPDLKKQQNKGFVFGLFPSIQPSSDAPFAQDNWPNSVIIKKQTNTWTINLLEGTLIPPSDSPFIPIIYDNPQIEKKLHVGYVNNRKLDIDAEIAFNQEDWPNPQIEEKRRINFSYSKQLEDSLDIPFVPIDYPNPLIKGKRNQGFTLNLLENTLAPPVVALPPGDQLNWSNARRVPRLITSLSSKPEEPVFTFPKNQYSWPNPAPKRPLRRDWNDFYTFDSSIIGASANYSNSDVFIRDKKRTALTHLYSGTLINFSNTPIRPTQSIFPNPLIKKRNQVGYTFSLQNELTVGNPFTAVIYPNPLNKRRIANTWTTNKPFYYTEPSGFSCAITLGIGAPGDITCFVLVGLDVNPQPFVQSNFNIPTVRRKPSALTYIQSHPFYYTESAQTVGGQFTTIPLRKKVINPSWSQSRPSYYTEPVVTIVTRVSWPNPTTKKAINRDWIDYFLFDPTIAPPAFRGGSTVDKLVPTKRSLSSYLGWISFRIPDTNKPTQPSNIFNNIVPNKKPIALSWINPGLNTSPEFSILPVGSSVYANPAIRRGFVQDWTQSGLSVNDVPTTQYDWPNPRVVKYGITFVQNRPFYYEETIPLFVNTDFPNPLLRKANQVGFLTTAQLTEDTPFVPYDLAIPIRGKRIADSWLINLLQSTLIPPAENVPFNQYDYPNPRLKGRGEGWIQNRPFYAIDSLPFIQTDWPIFIPVKRNQVGIALARVIIPEETNATQIYAVPLRSKLIAITWLQNLQEGTLNPIPFTSLTQKDWPNPLRGRINHVGFTFGNAQLAISDIPFISTIFSNPIVLKFNRGFEYNALSLLNSVEGELPFNQSSWPVFRKIDRNFIDYIQGMGIVLPQIVGRPICLLSEAGEYYLISEADTYDLESQRSEYNLDSDGHSCQ